MDSAVVLFCPPSWGLWRPSVLTIVITLHHTVSRCEFPVMQEEAWSIWISHLTLSFILDCMCSKSEVGTLFLSTRYR